MINFNESMYGRKVRFINAEAHEEMPEFYPEVGTVGIIVPGSYCPDSCLREEDYLVKWTKGSTSRMDVWACGEESLELVEESS